MQIEQHRAAGLDDVVQRPGVAPAEEAGRELEGVEGGADVGDDPEDEPERGPGHADDHGDVLAGHAEGYHAAVERATLVKEIKRMRGLLGEGMCRRESRWKSEDLHIVDHPVHRERAVPKSVRIRRRHVVRALGLSEGDLEGETDEGIRQAQE